MKISSLTIKNFRTLEDISLEFPSFYTAICGKNDSGKSNIIRALNTIFGDQESYNIFGSPSRISIQTDYTKWKLESQDGDQNESEDNKRESSDSISAKSEGEDKQIVFGVSISVDRDRDGGLFEFITTYLGINKNEEYLDLAISLTYESSKTPSKIVVTVDGRTFDDIKAQEIVKKLMSSDSYLLHNSTEAFLPYIFGRSTGVGMIRDFTPDYDEVVESIKNLVNERLKATTEIQQRELSQLLGRLEAKYRVSIAIPKFNLEYLPVNITLGDQNYSVPLNDWGSGTKNRTYILLTLFRAKQISDSTTSAEKITPVIIIEEPESFLHPSAQAEFGRVLQSLAEDFRVQVIVTTHSPYMLNQDDPASNVLLERIVEENNLRATTCVDTTGERWMEPFGLALGINNAEFQPWRDIFFKDSNAILLVEGEIDRDYFELLLDEKHGNNRLLIDGEIFPYGGVGNLNNGVLLRFIKNRHKKVFITYDLDVEQAVEKQLKALGFVKEKDYFGIGLAKPGRKNIEGLLPDAIHTKIYANNAELTSQAINGTNDEQKEAKREIKKLLLNEFKNIARPGSEFANFYPIVNIINKALSSDC